MTAQTSAEIGVVLFDGAPAPDPVAGWRAFEALGEGVVPGVPKSPRYLLLGTGTQPEPVSGADVRIRATYAELARERKQGAPAEGGWVLVVMLDVDEDHAAELEQGYAHHLAGRLRFPGFAAASLNRCLEGGGPRYLALYELTDPGAPTSKEYLSQPPDPTNALIREHAQLRVRQVYARLRDGA